ncbi:MAG TPA: hypothetical protein VIH45_07955 [Desulfuromonadaceae bacterium]
MKLNKKLVAMATAGALTALTAIPAMAFENEFHGAYTLKYYLSNYEQGGGGNPLAPTVTGGKTLVAPPAGNQTENLRLNNYFEQRARIFYTAKASDDLKLVTAFEIDSVFGDKAQGSISTTSVANGQFTFRNSGGAMESDAVNLETKWVYLQFKIPSTPTTVLAGIQPFKDSLKGILLDADIAGVITSTKLGAATVNAGYLRAYDQSFFSTTGVGSTSAANVKGNQNLDIGALELKYDLTKDTKLGVVYYLYADGRPFNVVTTPGNSAPPVTTGGVLVDSATMIHTFGLTGETKVGPVALSGFLAYQGGVLRNFNAAGVGQNGDSAYLNAFAYNLAAKAPVGPGSLRSALLFTSGNSNDASTLKSKHLTGWVGTSQSLNSTWASNTGTSSYNEGGMMLLNRNALNNNTTTDNAIIYNTSNGTNPVDAQGMYLYTLGYDANITPKLYTNVNAGAAWAAHTNSMKPFDNKTGKQNATNYMGSEVNLETGYKMYDNLTARFQAAYVFLGGYYKGSSSIGSATTPKDPENPYTARLILSYAF